VKHKVALKHAVTNTNCALHIQAHRTL